MSKLEDILTSLRSSKNRITKTRTMLIEVILKSSSPMSVLELMKSLERRKLIVNKTTAYRELDFLIKQGIIREVDLLEGLKRYELKTGDCHHHLVCLKCESINCVDIEHSKLEPVEKQILIDKGFKVQSHTLEFFGICKECA